MDLSGAQNRHSRKPLLSVSSVRWTHQREDPDSGSELLSLPGRGGCGAERQAFGETGTGKAGCDRGRRRTESRERSYLAATEDVSQRHLHVEVPQDLEGLLLGLFRALHRETPSFSHLGLQLWRGDLKNKSQAKEKVTGAEGSEKSWWLQMQ